MFPAPARLRRAMLTDHQREKLCILLHHALVAIRMHGWSGRAEQAAALADACHNLPLFLYRPDFDWQFARLLFEQYDETYLPDRPGGGLAAMLAEIEAEAQPAPRP